MGPYIDYWDYSLLMRGKTYARGYDMRRNFETSRNFTPEYATELFTREAVETITSHDKTKPLFLIVNHLAPHAANEEDPMQAKQEDIDKFSYIANEKRRTLAGNKNCDSKHMFSSKKITVIIVTKTKLFGLEIFH